GGGSEKARRNIAHAAIERSGGWRHRPDRRAAAGMDLFAKAHFESEHVAGALRPEHAGATGAGEAGHHEPIDLGLVESGLVKERLQYFAGQYPNVAIALFHHLGFGISDDGVVT